MFPRAVIAEATSLRLFLPHEVPLIAGARRVKCCAILDFDLITGVPLQEN